MTDQMEPSMPMASMVHAHNFLRVPPLASPASEVTLRLESLALAARTMVLGDEPSRAAFVSALAKLQPTDSPAAGPGTSYNLAAVLDILSGISYCANEPAQLASTVTRFAAYLVDSLSPLRAGATAFQDDLQAMVSSWITENPVSYWRSITSAGENNAALSGNALRAAPNRPLNLRPALDQRFTRDRGRVIVFFPPALPAKLLEWSPTMVTVMPPKQAVSGRIYFSRIPAKAELETLASLTEKWARNFPAAWAGSFLARVSPVSWMIAPADNAGTPVTMPRPAGPDSPQGPGGRRGHWAVAAARAASTHRTGPLPDLPPAPAPVTARGVLARLASAAPAMTSAGADIAAPGVLLLAPGGSAQLDIALPGPVPAGAISVASAAGLVGIGPVTVSELSGAGGVPAYVASVTVTDLAGGPPLTDASLASAYDTLEVTGPASSQSVAVWLTQPDGRWEGVQVDVTTTADSATVTSAAGEFTTAQVGQGIVIPGAGVDGTLAGTTLPGTLRATITALDPADATASGSVTVSPPPAFAVAGAASTVGGVGLQLCGVHAVVLSSGDVLYFSYNGDYASQTAGSWGNLPTAFQDINDGLAQRVSVSDTGDGVGFGALSAVPAMRTARNMFCACQCLLPGDGKVFAAGGQIFAPAAEKTYNYWGMLESLASTGDGEAFLTVVLGAIAAGIITLTGATGILGLGLAGAIAAVALAVDLSEPFLPDPHGSTPDVHLFDNTGTALTRLPSMTNGRYYPTCAVLRDGTVVIMGGLDNLYLYTFANVFLNLGAWGDNETVGYFPPSRVMSPPTQSFGQFGALDNYPIVQVLPNTDYIFVHSDDTTQMWLDSGGAGTIQPVSGASFVTPAVDSSGHTAHITYPAQTGAVLLPVREGSNPRILAVGGSPVGAADLVFKVNEPTDVALQTCSVFTWDLNGSAQNGWGSSGWSRLPARLNSPRVLADTVLLPDSTVLIINGAQRGIAESSSNPVFQPELFDPGDESIRPLAADPTSTPRKYHSTAVLLPDGRVLVAGNTGMYNNNPDIPLSASVPPPGTPMPNPTPPDTLIATVFHPPCLYRGPRPLVSAGTSLVVTHGSQFDVTCSANGSAAIVQASLVRPCAVTHSVDMSQRLIELEILGTDPAAGTMTLQAPSDGTVAPPGPYMLFVVNALGAVSVGSWLFIG